MKISFLFLTFFSFSLISANAQEYWDRTDFEIGDYNIRPALSDLNFENNFIKDNFNLPSGKFLNVDDNKPRTVNIVALIERENTYQKRTVDIGSPIPKIAKKEKKTFEVTGDAKIYDRDEVRNDALNANPFYRNQQFYQNRMNNQMRARGMYTRGYYSPYRPYAY